MLKVGLIGCGFMGTMHANCYNALDGVELTAVADIRPEKAEQLADGAQIYCDGKELIENADVDVIDICLPTYLHAEYTMLAMDKVKYVFVEKPVTLTVEESEQLKAKQAETGAFVQIGQVIRFWDEYVALYDMVRSGKYGRVVNANFRRISPSPDWGWNNWLHDTKLSGGAAQDLHIHDVDYVLSLFGEPKSVSSVRNIIGEENSYVNTFMQYDTCVVTVEGTWDLPASHPFEATFRVVFEDAVVENAGGRFMLYTTDGAEEIKIEKKDLTVSGGTSGNISSLGGYFNELCYFTECAKNGTAVEKATLADAATSLKFLLTKELKSNA
ncbi:MAG: Gfo/Idh/MocA family oxidoreductase [Oscillospiraceae bacterium]|nr:Gfo/Idh/MocA family oxidoreductase [Oscillospiraceae bacterium]